MGGYVNINGKHWHCFKKKYIFLEMYNPSDFLRRVFQPCKVIKDNWSYIPVNKVTARGLLCVLADTCHLEQLSLFEDACYF